MQPLVTALRKTFGGEATIDLVCMDRCLPAAHLIHGLDQIHTVARGTGEITSALQARDFHYLLDFHGSVRSRSLARSLDVMSFRVDKQAWNRWKLIQGWRKPSVSSFVGRCFDVLKPFDVRPPASDLWGKEAWGALNLKNPLPKKLDLTPHVVVALGSSHAGKHLSDKVVEAAIQTSEQKGCKVVIVGGPTEAERAKQWHNGTSVTSFAGVWSLEETAIAIRDAAATVSGDTATMHLAAAVGTPLAAVWGCTKPSLGLSPWRPHPGSIDVLPHGRSTTRPCSKHGATCQHTRSTDPFHPSRCGQQVDPEALAAWLCGVLDDLSRTTPSTP